MLQALAEDLWIADAPLRFLGLEVGARMTVVRLADGHLLLHSPVAADGDLVAAVAELGAVAYLVAPNRLHHLFVGDWKRAFPDAEIHVAPGLDTKRSDLAISAVLGEEPCSGWRDDLDQTVVGGFPFANEVVFFHPASATLIATDLAFNFGDDSTPLTRLVTRLAGTYGELAPSLLERALIRDRARYWGWTIGTAYGEPFASREEIGVTRLPPFLE